MNTIGLVGSLLLALSGIPEMIRTIRDKRCHVGWGLLLMWFFGEVLCVVYGLQLGEIPLLINYLFNVVIISVMLFYKTRTQLKTNNMDSNPIEKCIICKKDTTYHFNDHIDMRYGYIEGSGQYCISCYNKGNKHKHIIVPEDLIYNTPNDQELGSKVRDIYRQSK
jgi:uncharacterized protein with PQ loop repeat